MLKIPSKFPLSDHENVGDLAEDGNVQRNVQSFKTLVLSHCSVFYVLCFATSPLPSLSWLQNLKVNHAKQSS